MDKKIGRKVDGKGIWIERQIDRKIEGIIDKKNRQKDREKKIDEISDRYKGR